MLRIFPKILLVALSLFCVIGAPAAFTPVVVLAAVLMVLSGAIGYAGHIKLAVVNLGLTALAISLSPLTDFDNFSHSITLTALYLTPFLTGFGGVVLGVWRVTRAIEK